MAQFGPGVKKGFEKMVYTSRILLKNWMYGIIRRPQLGRSAMSMQTPFAAEIPEDFRLRDQDRH